MFLQKVVTIQISSAYHGCARIVKAVLMLYVEAMMTGADSVTTVYILSLNLTSRILSPTLSFPLSAAGLDVRMRLMKILETVSRSSATESSGTSTLLAERVGEIRIINHTQETSLGYYLNLKTKK